MRRSWTFLLVMLSLMAAPYATAAGGDTLSYDQVEFTVQTETELSNDLAEVVLAAQAEHSDPAQVAKEINDTMAWALNQVHGSADIAANSGSYQTYPVYDKTRLDHWRGIQTLVLRSKQIAALNKLVGKLQQRLQVQNMRFSVSPDQQQASESRLMDQALEQFKARALRIQERLGAKSYELVSLKIGTSATPPPFPVERMAMARVESSPPVAGAAGTSRQSLSVQAVIQLRF
jgi:predicted secreted protein